MNVPILELQNLSKVYVMGELRTAKKANKEIIKLHRKYQRACCKPGFDYSDMEKKLQNAQDLFAKEKYAEAYTLLTGKTARVGKREKGVVVHALTDINLKIEEGDMVAIMGPSGSGKSTLLNMLGLLDAPTTGTLSIRGENITKIKDSELPNVRARELGFVFQSFNLIPTLTALENVMLPLRYSKIPVGKRRKLAEDALKSVGLSDRMGHNPNELSGGQSQRVAIARSLVNNPAIIFGDELTGELDSKMTKEVMELILGLNKKGQTFVIVTHNPEVAAQCKRTIMMRDGRIVKS